ncbi:HAD family hydrolase [Actinomadura darangshiensis]|uniref:HAD family hydrolase n=1 Tax=Actinomadura darangshiensis TaxID=705336 RepID=A0A4R5BFK4_9ACTN|nr:HAD family hydrolase [Actinomadura darangshiensis]TDD82594.1 HAD family hydrolase [Actinomadura darangshiensis]
MGVQAVIFDWGGTLTPWHDLEPADIWRTICSPHLPADTVEKAVSALVAAEGELWRRGSEEHRSATLAEAFAMAGVRPTDALLAAHFETWTPHTHTDPAVPGLFGALRERGIKIGVLSNTIWTRAWHERVFARDDVLGMLDGAVYSSEIPWTKPHAEAFRAAMDAVGATDPASCVFVGDRPYDDIHGAKAAGLRAVQIRHQTTHAFERPGLTPPDALIHSLDELLPHVERWCSP